MGVAIPLVPTPPGAENASRQQPAPRARRGQDRWQWRSAAGVVVLGMLLAPGRGTAQGAQNTNIRLMWRPRAMATGTRTAQSGTFPISDGSSLYVPPKCVGSRRCPLMIDYADGDPYRKMATMQRGVDEFGILLLMTPFSGGTVAEDRLTAVVQQVLAQYAVDPDKIAISDVPLALANPNVFNRTYVIYGTPGTTMRQPDPRNPRVEIFEDAGVTADYRFVFTTVAEMAKLRAQGYSTKQWLGLRAHGFIDAESYSYRGYGPDATFYFLARWLDESWRIPDPAARPRPALVADPLPLLTPKAMTQMLTFWGSFQQEPDSICRAARQRHLREVLVPVGPKEAPPSTGMVDMAALVAEVPTVAAKLKAVGLTAQQHDAYRLALLSAIVLAAAQNRAAAVDQWHPSLVVDGNSVMGHNVAFVLAHSDDLLALEQTAIWMTP